MRTIATTALFFTLALSGAAPAAQADHGHARDGREIEVLAKHLARASDELARDARRAAGRVDRHEARALEAIYHLERTTDEFRRDLKRRDTTRRDVRRDFRQVERTYRWAFETRRPLLDGRRGRELRRDFERVDRLIAALDESFHDRRHIVRHEHDRRHARIAWR